MENLKVITLNVHNEELRDIENYEGLYQISNQGRVFSLISKKFLKPRSSKGDYQIVALYKDGKGKNYKIHRLVALAFLENPSNLPEVNHISEDKTDNRLCNLEWISHKDNLNYGSRTERMMQHPNCRIKQPKPVLQFTRQGEFVAEYASTNEAHRQTKINQGHISACCLGKRHSAGNYIWQFKEEVA